MSYDFDENYFENALPHITGNKNLREPQLNSYIKALEYYTGDYDNRNSLIILPTGVGKTGVMALLPFKLSKKRTLIITPGTAIKDTVIKNLDPLNPDNFWYKANVFEREIKLPNVIEYEGKDTPDEVLNVSNIVILNIHKLQSRLESSLTNRVSKDFFDLIIIDEAHHSTATTWIECVKYFEKAKIIKLTGTPFRPDGEKINGTLIYEYPLSRAMYNQYVKSLSNTVFIPKELKLSIDDNESKLYTVDEIFDLGIKDQEWVTRSVAYSLECSESIVDASIDALNAKKFNSNVPHKIIAIACSIKHANQIATLYNKKGLKSALIHSKMPKEEQNKVFADIDNNRVDVVINIAMLGEGYDHPYLSVAAIFRPFRSELPYAQFVGRVLRYINDEKATASDNIATIISHKHLYLDDLWNKYKKEINESKIIASLKDYDDILDNPYNDSGSSKEGSKLDIGVVKQSPSHVLNSENYLDTELIERSKEEAKKTAENIKKISEMLGISSAQASAMIKQSKANSALGRPDQLYKRKRRNINELIKESIIPRLIENNGIDKDGVDLKNLLIFKHPKYKWIPNQIIRRNSTGKNAGMLAIYISVFLNEKIGTKRDEWKDSDYDTAFDYLDKLENHLDSLLKQYYNQ